MKKFLPIFMAILLIVVMAVPAFAYSAILPTRETINDSESFLNSFPYSLIVEDKNANEINMYITDSSPIYTNNSYVKVSSREVVYIYELEEYNGGLRWVQKDLTVEVQELYPADVNFLYTSHDIIYGNDSNNTVYFAHDPDFFTVPLNYQIQMVATETLKTETLPAVAGTMTTLTLCGVGLMALLVVLNLFGKRSLISRS